LWERRTAHEIAPRAMTKRVTSAVRICLFLCGSLSIELPQHWSAALCLAHSLITSPASQHCPKCNERSNKTSNHGRQSQPRIKPLKSSEISSGAVFGPRLGRVHQIRTNRTANHDRE